MFHPRSPRAWHVDRVKACYFGFGLIVGFLLASFAWTLVALDPPIALSSNARTRPISVFPCFSRREGEGTQTNHDTSFQSIHSTNDKVGAASTSSNGWKLIHVYVGTNSTEEQAIRASSIPNAYFHSTKWFSQLRQDLLVSLLLRGKRDGYFVDLAANDAIRISNTYALETNFGWRGLAIEPNPIYWSGLSFRKCDVVGAVIGNRTGEELRFKFSKRAPPKGGLIGSNFDNKGGEQSRSSTSNEEQMRFTVSLAEVFERFHTPDVIDYLSLDVEGAEFFIMESFPFELYKFNLLTVERADDRLCALLSKHGYVRLKQLKRWGETIWMHTSAESIIDRSALLSIDTENYKYRENGNQLEAK
jgi:Methyltransferase FkbM domain